MSREDLEQPARLPELWEKWCGGVLLWVLAYPDLEKESQQTTRYEKKYIEFTAGSFSIEALKLSNIATASKR